MLKSKSKQKKKSYEMAFSDHHLSLSRIELAFDRQVELEVILIDATDEKVCILNFSGWILRDLMFYKFLLRSFYIFLR